MAKKQETENEQVKDDHLYLPIGARGVVYPYEMVDNSAAYMIGGAVILSLICLTVGINVENAIIKYSVYWTAVGLELLLLFFLIAYHKIWYESLRSSDEFTLLYDTNTGEVVCYLHTAREKRILASEIVSVSAAPNLLFRPLSRLFNLLTHDLGNVTIQYVHNGRRKRLVVRDFTKPTLAGSRLESLLKKLKDGEKPTSL